MGKFLSGLLLGGLACAFCVICYLPLNIANDIRGWVNKPAVQIVEVDNNTQTQDTSNGDEVNILPQMQNIG